jgi:hypothetical protein
VAGRCAPKLQAGINVPLIVGVATLLGIQIYWTARSVAMDYSRPYSAASIERIIFAR